MSSPSALNIAQLFQLLSCTLIVRKSKDLQNTVYGFFHRIASAKRTSFDVQTRGPFSSFHWSGGSSLTSSDPMACCRFRLSNVSVQHPNLRLHVVRIPALQRNGQQRIPEMIMDRTNHPSGQIARLSSRSDSRPSSLDRFIYSGWDKPDLVRVRCVRQRQGSPWVLEKCPKGSDFPRPYSHSLALSRGMSLRRHVHIRQDILCLCLWQTKSVSWNKMFWTRSSAVNQVTGNSSQELRFDITSVLMTMYFHLRWTITTMILVFLADAYAPLDPVQFYKKECPRARRIVGDMVLEAIRRDIRLSAALLRLQFHDCFVRVSLPSYI